MKTDVFDQNQHIIKFKVERSSESLLVASAAPKGERGENSIGNKKNSKNEKTLQNRCSHVFLSRIEVNGLDF